MTELDVLKNELLRIAEEDKNSYFVCIDGTEQILLPSLREKYPDRVLFAGISEQNAVSMASGLALSGKTVFLIVLAVFGIVRAFDQLKLDLSYNNANVKFITLKSGIRFNSEAGYSHWCIEDIAVLRTLSNIKVLSPFSMGDLKHYLNYAHKTHGSFIIKTDNILSSYDIEFDMNENKLSKLKDGKDAAIITTGYMSEYACDKLAPKLALNEINVSIYNAGVLIPFDKETVINLIDKKIPIVTIEEHTYGGLSSIVADVIAEYGKSVKFLPIRIGTEQFNFNGLYKNVANKLLDLDNIPNKIVNFLPKKFKFITKTKYTGTDNTEKIKYKFCNSLTILKKIKRKKIKANKPDYKSYLFGFLRIK